MHAATLSLHAKCLVILTDFNQTVMSRHVFYKRLQYPNAQNLFSSQVVTYGQLETHSRANGHVFAICSVSGVSTH
jgi:hypothetical protein